MSLSDKGEGGTIVLKTILDSLLTPGITASAVSILTIIGIALFIGDGVITPAISILSAVEGILLIPGFEETDRMTLLFVAALIAIGLFLFQSDLVFSSRDIRRDLDHHCPAGSLRTEPGLRI